MIKANQQVLEQAIGLVRLLDDDQYRDARPPWSSVGAHLRHVIEHYQSFVEGLPQAEIDYDARRRDPTIEASRTRAIEVLAALIEQLDRVRHEPADRPVSVQLQCEADAVEPTWAGSTVGRELQFLLSHAVHHYALIKMLLSADGMVLDEEFGTAPSTISHSRHVG